MPTKNISRGAVAGKVLKILIFAAFCLRTAHGENSSCKLPAALVQIAADRWPGWSLLQVNDLVSDDQNLWLKNRDNACPGLIRGHFVSPDKLSYAFTLINQKSNEQQVILAIPINDGGFTIRILSAPLRVVRFSVIHALPPGKYSEVEGGRTVRTKVDSIAYETIEAGETMFYEERGSFHSLLLSE